MQEMILKMDVMGIEYESFFVGELPIAKVTGHINEKLVAMPYPGIKKVIFNNPATIILWNDGTRTVVKCNERDIYDPEKGFAMAISEKVLGGQAMRREDLKDLSREQLEQLICEWIVKCYGLEDEKIKLEKERNKLIDERNNLLENSKSYDFAKLQDQHQQDCIKINQLNVTIDTLVDKYSRLRKTVEMD